MLPDPLFTVHPPPLPPTANPRRRHSTHTTPTVNPVGAGRVGAVGGWPIGALQQDDGVLHLR
eukprot:m.392095 g.392095  ORF g.392095 m.392095 type:complete len:62 (+) comp28322_c0_seq1:581-766(+)